MATINKTGLTTRDEFQSFMNVTPTAESEAWKLIGEGFSELTENLNPKTKDSSYINQKSGTSSVIGYAPTFDFTAETYMGDPVIDFIAEIGAARKVGAECETDIVNVHTYEAGKTEGTVVAYKQHVAIRVDTAAGGPGGDAMPLVGAFLYQGDPIKGEWNLATKTFAELK